MYAIGIDIGTSSVCGIRYNIDKHTMRSVTLPNDSAIKSENTYEKIQDPQRILEIVKNIIDEFIEDREGVTSIGVTGQMHGILYVDHDGNAVSPLYTWQDGRGNLMMSSDESYASALSRYSLEQVATGYGLVTHYYNQLNDLIPSEAVGLCTVMDYVVMKLTGLKSPVIEYSNAASLGFFDKLELRFDFERIRAAGVDYKFLPEVVPAKEPAGLYNGIAVYPAIGDNQAAFLGSVEDVTEEVHITVGTSSQISIFTPDYVSIPTIDTRPLPGGGYILVGAELCGGYALSILKDFFAATVRDITGESVADNLIYDAMSRMHRSIGDRLKVDTRFDGTRIDPNSRGCISEISSTNFLPGNLVDGFICGLSEALYNYYMLFPESLKKNKTHIVASGNGMRKNKHLREAFAYRFKMPVVLSASLEEAAFGAAKCALRWHYNR